MISNTGNRFYAVHDSNMETDFQNKHNGEMFVVQKHEVNAPVFERVENNSGANLQQVQFEKNDELFCCGLVFTKRVEYDSHMKCNHEERGSQPTHSENTLSFKEIQSVRSKYVKCIKCQKMFSSQFTQFHNKINKSGETLFQCNHCLKARLSTSSNCKCKEYEEFLQKSGSLKGHQGTHDRILYHCEICSKTFPLLTFIKHKKSYATPERRLAPKSLQCYMCAEICQTPSDLVNHYACHTLTPVEATENYTEPEVLFYDAVCQKTCEDVIPIPNAGLNESIKKPENGDHGTPMSTPIISMNTTGIGNQETPSGNQELPVDSYEVQFVCKFCSIAFQSLALLKTHKCQFQSLQLSKYRVSCKYCEETFHSLIHLKSHEQLHFKNSSYISGIEKNETTKHSTHMNGKVFKQTYNKPYRCNYCPKTYIVLTCLEKHQKKHQLPQSYQCYLCAQSFDKSCDLVEHFKSHKVPLRKYSARCKEAGETKSSRHVLNSSKQLKSLWVPQTYQCFVCAQYFKLSSDLAKHLACHNNIVSSDVNISEETRTSTSKCQSSEPKFIKEEPIAETKVNQDLMVQRANSQVVVNKPQICFFDALCQNIVEPNVAPIQIAPNFGAHSPNVNYKMDYVTQNAVSNTTAANFSVEMSANNSLNADLNSCKENVQSIIYAGDKSKPTHLFFNEECPLKESPFAFVL